MKRVTLAGRSDIIVAPLFGRRVFAARFADDDLDLRLRQIHDDARVLEPGGLHRLGCPFHVGLRDARGGGHAGGLSPGSGSARCRTSPRWTATPLRRSCATPLLKLPPRGAMPRASPSSILVIA